jgi:hypothetical protein
MKKLITIAALCAVTMTAFADTTASTSTASQTLSGTSAATNQGNAQSITFTAPADTVIRNAPSMGAPSLTSSYDTCSGSVSAAISGLGFGVAAGGTQVDANCVMLKNTRELWNMGMKAAAIARMCMDSDNRASLEMTGFVCPQTVQAQKAAADQPQYTDPIIRARLGLAPLSNTK